MDTRSSAPTPRVWIRQVRRAALIAAVPLLCAQAVHAQAVRKCVVEGRIVYQSPPCPASGDAPAASASASPPVAVATTNGAAPKKKTLADALRERDASNPTTAAPREAQGDGANILRSRMGAG